MSRGIPKAGKKAKAVAKAKTPGKRGRKSLSGVSVETLRAELQRREATLLADTVAQRDELNERIAQLQADMGGVQPRKAGRKPGRPVGSGGKQKRAKNVIGGVRTSLRKLVLEVLTKNKDKAMNLAEIVTACREAGYQSNTKGKFPGIVYQTLYKLVKEKAAVQEKGKKEADQTGRAPMLWKVAA